MIANDFHKWLATQQGDPHRFSPEDWQRQLLYYMNHHMKAHPISPAKRKLYYVSAEFLLGRLLINNLHNLGLYEDVCDTLEDYGVKIGELEELETEPSLGNGGLGRLAACFLDSLTSLDLSCTGISLAYSCGLFRQDFVQNQQFARPDLWMDRNHWLVRNHSGKTLRLDEHELFADSCTIKITGAGGRVNDLVLFSAYNTSTANVHDGIGFDPTNIPQNLLLFLYPDDSTPEGRLLRLYQETFLAVNAAELILKESVERGCKLRDLHEYAAIQLNDTHPSLLIPELIRLLTERGLSLAEAAGTVTRACAYTNHTIMAEALEVWPRDSLKQVAPQLLPVIEELQRMVAEKTQNPKLQIIDGDGMVHMAAMDIHYSSHTNGVAQLHTEILKGKQLKDFHELYPDRICNMTNGVSFRRWLHGCNPELTRLIHDLIGPRFLDDAAGLEQLLLYADSRAAQTALAKVKRQKKEQLAAWLLQHQGDSFKPNSILDVQVKRFHEYKRQQLNCLWVIWKYLQIRRGHIPPRPITVLLGGKAAPAYTTARNVIHLALCLGDIINSDPQAAPYLKLIVVKNYNVTAAERILPAADISEQISLASTEASGTGVMKMALNGALTLGTMDGVNVELHQAVGSGNIYIFGDGSQTVLDRYAAGSYRARDYYEDDPELREAMDFIVGPEMMAVGDPDCLHQLYNELLNKDWYMTFPDFRSYLETKECMLEDYESSAAWRRKMIVNIANSGKFSSDRTIREYNQKIWKL